MLCPQCGHVNPHDAQVCVTCGATLHLSDEELRTQLFKAHVALSKLQRFVPRVVAQAVLTEQAYLQGEQREVAVLFVDAVNFTRLSASLDAESVFRLVNDFLSRLVAAVHRYDGLVDKFTGDGLMAVFGAPRAHENDAELAVRAALDMQRAMEEFAVEARARIGAPLQVRIGIHVGPAVAGIVGSDEQAAYTVIGETVNLAARLESQARPGHILVSERVYQLARPFFDFRDGGYLTLKGLEAPMAVFEVIGQRQEPLAERGVAGVTTIFLGHDEDLKHLQQVEQALLEDRVGRVVLIQGEAGMGKSRLVAEWLARMTPGHFTIYRGRGLPYSQGIAYSVFRSLLQNAMHSAPPDAPWDEHLTPRLRLFLWRILGILPQEEEKRLRYLEAERVKQLTELAVREWVLTAARKAPLLLVLDDFHWADNLSRELVQVVSRLVSDVPLLLVIMTRPQPENPLKLEVPAPLGPLQVPIYHEIPLSPLSEEHSRQLLGHLIALDDLPEEVIQTILRRAEGNPFYIEEFVRLLIEKDLLQLREGRWRATQRITLDTLEIPTTLRGLMMTRVDQLPESMRDLLRSAAVIGLQFSVPVLEEVQRRLQSPAHVKPLLEHLVELGVLERRFEAGEDVYAFRHILTQETLYASLLRLQRPRLHQTVAEAIESLYAQALDRYVEVLAYHYDQARVREKALTYALAAGEKARDRYANHEAVDYFSRALQLSQHISGYETTRWQAAINLGDVETRIGEYDEAVACYRAALEEHGSVSLEEKARVMLRLGQVWSKRGELEEAEGWLRQALALNSEPPYAIDLLAEVYSELGWIQVRRGNLDQAREWLEKALVLVRPGTAYNVIAGILNRLGGVYFYQGDLEAAAYHLEEALELRNRLGDLIGYARSLNNLGVLRYYSGDWDGSLQAYEEAAKLHEQNGEIEGLAQASTNLGILYTDRGEWAKAEHYLQRSFELAQRIGQIYEVVIAHLNLGQLRLLQKRWAECLEHLETARRIARENKNPSHLIEVYILESRLCLEQDRYQDAERILSELNGLLGEGKQSAQMGIALYIAGQLAYKRGDYELARHHLEQALAILDREKRLLDAARTRFLLACTLQHLGDSQAAQQHLDQARNVFRRLKARLDLELLEHEASCWARP